MALCIDDASQAWSSSRARYHCFGRGGTSTSSELSSAGWSISARAFGSATLESWSATLWAIPGVCRTEGGNAAVAVIKANSREMMACCLVAGLILTTRVNEPTLSPRTRRATRLLQMLVSHNRAAMSIAKLSHVCCPSQLPRSCPNRSTSSCETGVAKCWMIFPLRDSQPPKP